MDDIKNDAETRLQFLIYYRNSKGTSFLGSALGRGCLDHINFLLQAGAFSYWANEQKRMTCLHIIARHKKNDFNNSSIPIAKDIFKLDQFKNQEKLKNYIDAQDDRGRTALHYAVLKKKKKLVEYLLQRGAARNKQDNHGNTPLHYAVKLENVALVRLLVTGEKKAAPMSSENLQILNKQVREPLELAVASLNPPIVKLLCDNGARADKYDPQAKNLFNILEKSVAAKKACEKQRNREIERNSEKIKKLIIENTFELKNAASQVNDIFLQ